jgi:hypothetical protein
MRQPTTTQSDGKWVLAPRKERDRSITWAIAVYGHGGPGVRLEASGKRKGVPDAEICMFKRIAI